MHSSNPTLFLCIAIDAFGKLNSPHASSPDACSCITVDTPFSILSNSTIQIRLCIHTFFADVSDEKQTSFK